MIKTQNIFYIFPHPYNKIVDSIKNILNLSYLMRRERLSIVKYPFYLVGDPSNEKGAKFIQKTEDNVEIYFEVTELIETDYYTEIEFFSYKTVPKNIEYKYRTRIMNLNYYGGRTIIISEYEYSKDIIIDEEFIALELNRRRKIFNNIDKLLYLNYLNKFDIKASLINANIKIVFNVMLNLKLIHKFLNALAKNFLYEGNILKKEMNVKFLWWDFTSKNLIEYDSIISELHFDLKESLIEFYVKQNKDKTIEEQKIKFLFYGRDGKTMFFWINEYYEILNEEKVFYLGTKKTNVLNKLKKMFENYQNKEMSKQ
jgi:hypothetical protein